MCVSLNVGGVGMYSVEISVGVQTRGRRSLDNLRYRVDSTAASVQLVLAFVKRGV